MPHSIAEYLKERPAGASESFAELITESYAEATVLFADILEFTKFSEGASAHVLSGVLNDISARFDGPPERQVFERSKTIGDAYLDSVGLPGPLADHTIGAANMALDLVEAMDRFNAHSRYKLKVRIGLDTEEALDDVIGKRRLLYDV